MKKLIVKPNEWYDNLKEPKRTLIFIIFVFVPLFLSQYIIYGTDGKWSRLVFPAWIIFISIYRISYVFINELENSIRYCSMPKKKNIEIYHWVKEFQFGTGIDAISECGLSTKEFPKMRGCSNPYISVNCPECIKKRDELEKDEKKDQQNTAFF